MGKTERKEKRLSRSPRERERGGASGLDSLFLTLPAFLTQRSLAQHLSTRYIEREKERKTEIELEWVRLCSRERPVSAESEGRPSEDSPPPNTEGKTRSTAKLAKRMSGGMRPLSLSLSFLLSFSFSFSLAGLPPRPSLFLTASAAPLINSSSSLLSFSLFIFSSRARKNSSRTLHEQKFHCVLSFTPSPVYRHRRRPETQPTDRHTERRKLPCPVINKTGYPCKELSGRERPSLSGCPRCLMRERERKEEEEEVIH